MSLDLSKLEKARQRGDKIIARCPACAELGHDEKAEHLVIMPDGRFGCVVHPGAAGKDHRKEIYALAGDKKFRGGSFNVRVRRPSCTSTPRPAGETVDVGRLGRVFSGHVPNVDPGSGGGLPEPAESLDGVGRFGRVSETLALRVGTPTPEDGEEKDVPVHTLSAGRDPSKASKASTTDTEPEFDEMDEINECRRRSGLPPIKPLPPDTPRDPETGFPIIDGSICPF